jgi:hypothetical protein
MEVTVVFSRSIPCPAFCTCNRVRGKHD